MGGRTRNRWKAFVAQVAVLLLVAQSTFGILACSNRFAVAPDGLPGGLICSIFSSPDNNQAPSQDPENGTHPDCPICASFVCHASAILTADLAIPASANSTVFEPDGAWQTATTYLTAVHNRGPPSSFQA